MKNSFCLLLLLVAGPMRAEMKINAPNALNQLYIDLEEVESLREDNTSVVILKIRNTINTNVVIKGLTLNFDNSAARSDLLSENEMERVITDRQQSQLKREIPTTIGRVILITAAVATLVVIPFIAMSKMKPIVDVRKPQRGISPPDNPTASDATSGVPSGSLTKVDPERTLQYASSRMRVGSKQNLAVWGYIQYSPNRVLKRAVISFEDQDGFKHTLPYNL